MFVANNSPNFDYIQAQLLYQLVPAEWDSRGSQTTS